METNNYSKAFITSDGTHILNITNHGIHEWEVVPGLRDTGGQNIFVNQLTHQLVKYGYKVTIINRGGFKHPKTKDLQTGTHYKSPYQRIHYIEDGCEQFVRKEDMGDRIPALHKSLAEYLRQDRVPIDMVISHYWDAGSLGALLKSENLPDVKHIWIPHSLGAIKDKMITADQRIALRMDERLEAESEIIQSVDGIGATSSLIRESLRLDYGYQGKIYWLPPCVDTRRYHHRNVPDDAPVWSFLSRQSGLPQEDIQSCRIISEISRTDRTKRKNVLIKAFADVHKNMPNTFLIMTIDDHRQKLAEELKALIRACGIREHTAVVGSIWDQLPIIYAISDIYCTPSIMEGFGMSAEEAAASKVPVVSSDKVVYVTEYLLGESARKVEYNQGKTFILGDGAVVVPADEIQGFRAALETLLADDKLRKGMGEAAFRRTIPYFTWENIIKDFIAELDE